MLLSKDAQVNSASRYFGTPLQAAAGQGHYEMVLHLLKHAENGNYVCDVDGTALRSASRRNQESVVRLLLDSAYKLEILGVYYENAIMDAVNSGHTEIVRLLLIKGTFVNKMSLQYGILWVVCRFGYLQIVQIMLDEGLEAKISRLEGCLALEFAACYGHEFIVSLLLDKGVDVVHKGVRFNVLQAAASNGHQEIVQILLDKGANINSSDRDNETPLLKASKNQ